MFRYSELNPDGDPVVRDGYAGDHKVWRIEPKKDSHGTFVSPQIALLGWRLDSLTLMYAHDTLDEDGVVVSSEMSKDRPFAPKVIGMTGKSFMFQARRYFEMHACDFFLTQQVPTYLSVRKNDTLFNNAFGLEDIARFAIPTNPDVNEEVCSSFLLFFSALLPPPPHLHIYTFIHII